MKQPLDRSVHIALPFRKVCDRQDGIHAVVSAGIDGFYIKATQFENAQDVAIFDDTLGQAYAVVPHVVRFLVERKPIEALEVHGAVIFDCTRIRTRGVRGFGGGMYFSAWNLFMW